MILQSDDINKIAKGDELSFCRFMEQHSGRLYYYAFGLVKQKEAAEEIVSDVFLKVWKNRKELKEITNINAWLNTITYRLSISYLRSKAEVTNISFDDVDSFLFTPLQSPDEKIISSEETERINKAIEQLPPKCKHVFFLAKIERLPYLEISKMLDISVKTINNHIAKALSMIAESLKK